MRGSCNPPDRDRRPPPSYRHAAGRALRGRDGRGLRGLCSRSAPQQATRGSCALWARGWWRAGAPKARDRTPASACRSARWVYAGARARLRCRDGRPGLQRCVAHCAYALTARPLSLRPASAGAVFSRQVQQQRTNALRVGPRTSAGLATSRRAAAMPALAAGASMQMQVRRAACLGR